MTGQGATSATDVERVVLRGGAAAALGYLLRFGARLLFLFMAARLFGVALFGAYSLAVAVVELAVAVGGLGMKRLLFKLLDERPPDRLASHVLLDAALLVTGASFILVAAVLLAVSWLPGSLLAGTTGAALLLIAPAIAGQALLDLMLAATRWKLKMRYEVAARSLVEPYAGIMGAIAAYVAGFEERGLLIGYWAGTLAALAFAVHGAHRCFGGFGLGSYRVSRANLIGVIRTSFIPTTTDFGGALFARLDLYLVGLFFGEVPAGVYNMARQIRTPIRQVRQSFDGMLTPLLARVLATAGTLEAGLAAASATRFILAIQLLALIVLIAIGEPLLAWLSPAFASAYWILLILAVAETIQGAFGVSELILLYRRPSLVLWITATSAAISAVGTWLLIHRFGLEGAAFSVLIATAAGAMMRRVLLRSSLGITVPLLHTAGPLFAAASAIGLLLATRALLEGTSPSLITAAALGAGLAGYAATLKLWLSWTGERLALANLQVR